MSGPWWIYWLLTFACLLIAVVGVTQLAIIHSRTDEQFVETIQSIPHDGIDDVMDLDVKLHRPLLTTCTHDHAHMFPPAPPKTGMSGIEMSGTIGARWCKDCGAIQHLSLNSETGLARLSGEWERPANIKRGEQ